MHRNPLARVKREVVARLPAPLVERWRFYRVHGHLPRLARPRTFSEKVLCRKLGNVHPLFAPCSDKYLVRSYVAERVGSDVLVPLVGTTRKPRELLDLESWRHCVFKPNHGSRMVMMFGTDQPDRAGREAAVATFSQWLRRDYADVYNERHYSLIEPRMVVERRIGTDGQALTEWKIHCFRQDGGSQVLILQVISDRFGAKSISYHDCTADGPRLIRLVEGTRPGADALPADRLHKALADSRRLAADFAYVRVDWFVTDDALFFSELTFTPGAGLSTTLGPALDRRMGDLWMQEQEGGEQHES